MISENYFDYAASTPLDPSVLKVMVPYFGDNFYNPSAGYLKAQKIAKDIKEARSNVANIFGCKSSEIFFVAGGTEANNLAITGLMTSFPDTNLVISSIEHDSVIAVASRHEVKKVKVEKTGHINIDNLKNKINDKTVLVSVIFVNNEIGTIQPIKNISEIIRKVRQERKQKGNNLPIYLHTDASQAGNYLSLNVNSLGVDMMTVNGGKIYGPKQSGVLFIRSGISIEPIIYGGGQEKGFRSGTENVAYIIGIAKAIERSQKMARVEQKRLNEIKDIFLNDLKSKFPNLIVNGGSPKSANIVNVTFPGVDNEMLMMKLDESGFEVAVGSACKASNDEPSHVLKAIGLSVDLAQSTIRVSMGRFTTKESAVNLANAIQKAC